MEALIKKWGNSPALRLSASTMKEAGLSIDQKVSVNVQRGKIVIEPVTVYSLDWKARKAKFKEKVTAITLEETRAKLRALLQLV